jgi:cell division protein FtsL
MKKKKYLKLKGESIMMSLIILFVVFTLVFNFIGKAMLQSKNSELQRLKSKIQTQEKLNASMQMKINELASLDNALEVADTFGLEYNNSNIRVVSE